MLKQYLISFKCHLPNKETKKDLDKKPIIYKLVTAYNYKQALDLLGKDYSGFILKDVRNCNL